LKSKSTQTVTVLGKSTKVRTDGVELVLELSKGQIAIVLGDLLKQYLAQQTWDARCSNSRCDRCGRDEGCHACFWIERKKRKEVCEYPREEEEDRAK
jgi:hypothetical protein